MRRERRGMYLLWLAHNHERVTDLLADLRNARRMGALTGKEWRSIRRSLVNIQEKLEGASERIREEIEED